jgi:hypothetical protein
LEVEPTLPNTIQGMDIARPFPWRIDRCACRSRATKQFFPEELS